jgi:hypothetical protein
MGQPIQLTTTTVDGDVAGFHTDRGITGQDGIGFDRQSAADADSLPGDLAARMFGIDESLDHVFVASNQVVARRTGAWDATALGTIGDVITGFFVFYPEG